MNPRNPQHTVTPPTAGSVTKSKPGQLVDAYLAASSPEAKAEVLAQATEHHSSKTVTPRGEGPPTTAAQARAQRDSLLAKLLRGQTLRQIAAKAGVHESSISHYLSAGRMPGLGIGIGVAEAVAVSPRVLHRAILRIQELLAAEKLLRRGERKRRAEMIQEQQQGARSPRR